MNMEHEEKIRLLLSMQENPNQYSDEQLHQMLADDPELAEMQDQLALTKRAFVKQEADDEAIPVDEEWQKFSATHFESEVPTPRLSFYKFAASFIGILLTIGMAFAAVHIVRTSSNHNLQTVQSESALHKTSPCNPYRYHQGGLSSDYSSCHLRQCTVGEDVAPDSHLLS